MEPLPTDLPYVCIVCKKPFADGWEHVEVGALSPWVDQKHKQYQQKVEKSLYELPCFCGGEIVINGHGEDSWDTSCTKCGFLFDED